jgi:putative tricarboxylic transport membrane protein
MPLNHKDVWLGIGTVIFGVLLLVYAIPEFISAPSNVRKLVLSPLLWPTIVAWLIILLGGSLIASHFLTPPQDVARPDPELMETREGRLYAWGRLGASALIMIGLIVATPVLGMVLACGLAFVLFSVVIMAPRPILSLIVAILLPFILYFFFAHVAGVSVPQGRFLSLP